MRSRVAIAMLLAATATAIVACSAGSKPDDQPRAATRAPAGATKALEADARRGESAGAVHVVEPPPSPAPGLAAFEPYWAEFRRAILADDVEAVAQLTAFPLEVHGVADGLPVEQVERDMFAAMHARIMDQEVFVPAGAAFVPTTLRDLVRDKESLSESEQVGSGAMRFQQLVFEWRDGRWRYVRAYLEE